jgi:hypothetical protein
MPDAQFVIAEQLGAFLDRYSLLQIVVQKDHLGAASKVTAAWSLDIAEKNSRALR